MVAALRKHPHVSNVLTHISGQSWARVEQTLHLILDANTTPRDLTPLGRNMVELMWAESGVTGRIFKPYLLQLLTALSGPGPASEILARIGGLAAGGDAGRTR
jgi:hypothetical protein